MFYVFDLDGTLANIDHRLHFIQGKKKDYDAFFKACVDDTPNQPVVDLFHILNSVTNSVEIWSGRSDIVEEQTREWLQEKCHILPKRLTHMRPHGDYQPDVDLKRKWLHALYPDERPDVIFDDRQSVVDMWRKEGITCCQVNSWEEKVPIVTPTMQPLLTIMVGPSGAGKSSYANTHYEYSNILSSDVFRNLYCGDKKDQSKNDQVFYAMQELCKTRLKLGLPVVIDATNLYKKDRMVWSELAPEGTQIQYIVINRPMSEKIRTGGWRNDIIHEKSGLSLMELHEQRFQSQLKDILLGDNLPNVKVADLRSK